MPIFYFHVHDDVSGPSLDETGVDLSNREAAEREALKFAGMTIASSATDVRRPKAWHLDVTDYLGTVVFSLDFAARPASADTMTPSLFTPADVRQPMMAQ